MHSKFWASALALIKNLKAQSGPNAISWLIGNKTRAKLDAVPVDGGASKAKLDSVPADDSAR